MIRAETTYLQNQNTTLKFYSYVNMNIKVSFHNQTAPTSNDNCNYLLLSGLIDRAASQERPCQTISVNMTAIASRNYQCIA
jgi:hypothetical protein